jgi:hypothetical protein
VLSDYSYKHDFDNDTKSTKGLALGTLKRQVTRDDIEEGRGRGSSLFAAGKLWLEGGTFGGEAHRKKRETGVPGFAGPINNSELPEAPSGEPGPNNSISDIMKQHTIPEGGIEMSENPMFQNNKDGARMKRFDSFKGAGAGRVRAPSKVKQENAEAGDV